MLNAAPAAGTPSGYDVYKWESAQLDWFRVDQPDDEGVFRFDSYRPEFRVVRNGSAKKVARSVAVYTGLARARISVIDYRLESHELRIPARARPPGLYARALTLCTGRLPVFEPRTGTLCYASVPGQFAATLRQQLESLETTSG
jgi:hypothetical protein